MSRLLEDRLHQHSTPDVPPYDQIESVTLVDVKWTQNGQTPIRVALTEFPGRPDSSRKLCESLMHFQTESYKSNS